MEPRGAQGLLRDSAILTTAATALAYVSGSLYDSAYYGRLGIQYGELEFPIGHYMNQGGAAWLLPVFFFLLYVVFDAVFFRKAGRPKLFYSASPAAMLAISSTAYMARRFAALGDDTWRFPWLDITLLDALIYLFFAGLVGFIALEQWRDRDGGESSRLLGRNHSGSMFLSMLAVLFILGSGILYGQDAGNDAAWGCHPLPSIVFEPTPSMLEANHTYWLIVHQNGNYYLRDLHDDPNTHDFIVVPESGVQGAKVSSVPELRNCR